MRYVVGIDAGGTKTVGLLADESGRVLAEARGSGANLQTAGELEVEKVFDDVLEALGRDHAIAAVCLGIAGVDRPQDEQVIKGILRRLGHRQTARVVNDAAIALAAGAPDRIGVVVLAGTGSIAYGQDRSGKVARAGGYGFLLADEGSGYWLGHQALRSVVRAADGRGPRTHLTPLVFEELEVGSVPELVPRVYERGLPKHRIAALAPLVQKAYERGDTVAADLIAQGARELALIARSVAAQIALGTEPYPVVLAGGVFKGCPALAEPLVAALELPMAQPALLQVEPARGAVNLALDLLR
jgi:N-acetylglucosamine kinase-like BadF-type ATPase